MMGCLYETMANHKCEEQLTENNAMERYIQIMEMESRSKKVKK